MRLRRHYPIPATLRVTATLGTAFAAATATLAFAADARDWPQWRGPGRDAVSPDTGLLDRWSGTGPPLAWKTSGLGAGFSSLAVAGGRIFTLGDRDGAQLLIALDGASGKSIWSTRVGPAWGGQYGGSRSTPTVDGDRVYALGTEGDLVCLDAATGRERWRRSLPGDFGGRMMSGWKFSESPLVDGDRVVVTPGAPDAALAALDKLTGREVWRASVPAAGSRGRDGAAYSSIVVSNGAGVRQYVQLTGRGLVGVAAQDGRHLWSYDRVANNVRLHRLTATLLSLERWTGLSVSIPSAPALRIGGSRRGHGASRISSTVTVNPGSAFDDADSPRRQATRSP